MSYMLKANHPRAAMSEHHIISQIVNIGETLHRAGCPPYKLEKYVEHYARNRGIEVMALASANWINFQFNDEDNTVVIKRLKPPSIDLTLLAQTINRITRDDESISLDSTLPSRRMQLLACLIVPAAYLCLVGSSYDALIVSPLTGLIVWLCTLVLKGRRAIALEFIAPLLVGLMAEYANSFGLNIPVWTLCIASILRFVPGLSIANALECLAFNDLVSGTSLLGQCILSLIKLFSGIFIGLSFGSAIWDTTAVAYTNELPTYFTLVGAAMLAIAVAIMFNIRPRDVVRAIPVIAIGTWGPTIFNFEHGWVAATWITSTLITLYATWIAKRRKLTGTIYMIQGIILMVPGSRVLISAGQNFYGAEVLPIAGIGSSAALIFAAIVVGQITAYAIYSPKIER